MRKFTIILTLFIAFAITSKAQIPNGGFENWTTFGSYSNPNGWATSNPFSSGSFYAVTKSTDHYPASVGNFSVRIENKTSLLPNFSAFGVIMPDTLAEPHPVFRISGHPNSLTGYYKYAPQNGDTMFILIELFQNGSAVSWGEFYNTTPASNWTSFDIPLSSYTAADSGHIILAAYNCNITTIPHGNSVLYIDNLNFDNLISGVSEQTRENNAFSLFPNPASDILTMNIENRNITDFTLNIYNVMGELVRSELLKQNPQQITISDLNNGIYFAEIKSGEGIEKQKIIIQR